NRSALSFLAANCAVLDFIFAHWPGPAIKVPSIEHRLKTPVVVRFQQPVRLIRANLVDEYIPPANFATVGLELDRPLSRNRRFSIVEVFQVRVVHDPLAVEPDTHARAAHQDAKGVPFSER